MAIDRPPDAPATLTKEEAKQFNSLLKALEGACSKHQYLFEHSFDYPIPGWAVREAAVAVDTCWKALIEWVSNAGLSQHNSTVEFPGVENEWLGVFFSESHHRAPNSDAYWERRVVSYIKEKKSTF